MHLDWIPERPDFELFNLYCHQKDYRVCWLLNERLRIELTRINDFLENPEDPDQPTYAQFFWNDVTMHRQIHLIANQPLYTETVERSGDLFATEKSELLIKELPKVDYFVQFCGRFEAFELQEMDEQLNLIPLISTVQRVDPQTEKFYLNLMH